MNISVFRGETAKLNIHIETKEDFVGMAARLRLKPVISPSTTLEGKHYRTLEFSIGQVDVCLFEPGYVEDSAS